MRIERIDLVENYIIENKKVTLDVLCEAFKVSKNTIRRDINFLADRGTIKKVYGGVIASDDATHLNTITPFSSRSTILKKEKDAICKYAASLVDDNDTIYIDTGTTSQNLIDYISDKHCTIITNSLQISLKAIPYPNLNIISLAGMLKRNTLSFVGNEAEFYLKTYNINKAFMCCTGITIENGLTNATYEEYLIKKTVIANSKTHILLADHTKFGVFTLMTYCRLTDLHHVITDRTPKTEYVEFFKQHDVLLHEASLL